MAESMKYNFIMLFKNMFSTIQASHLINSKLFVCLLDLWFRTRFLCTFYMFGSVRFRFGKRNFNLLVLFGSGRTIKHCFGRSLSSPVTPMILSMISKYTPKRLNKNTCTVHHICPTENNNIQCRPPMTSWQIYTFCAIRRHKFPQKGIVFQDVIDGLDCR